MDFDTWLGQAWDDHANLAPAVAERIASQGLALAAGDAQRVALARLAQHVYGSHLARWGEGRELLARIGAGLADDACRATLRMLDASLVLAGGLGDPRPELSASERVRIGALAAGSLAEHDAARASALLDEALAEAETGELADADPAVRALAVAGHGLACALEEKAARSEAERALMIHAARTSRAYWARAGTWLEVERAEYRLAMTWLHAGDLATARQHAQECLEIVRSHDAPALEAFFGWEALGTVERAAGNATGHAHALQQAREAFARLDAADAGWCRASLDKLGP